MSIVNIKIPECNGDEYILMPSCCYNGNRFNVLKKDYPPMYVGDEIQLDMETTITDVPRLNKDGSGKIEVTTGDLAVPCVGVYLKNEKKYFFVFTVQEINNKNIGIAYEKGNVLLSYPAKREEKYVWPKMIENEQEWLVENVEIPYKVIEGKCNSLKDFYRVFFENRKIMGLDDTLPQHLCRQEQVDILLKKYNTENWYEKLGLYGSIVHSTKGKVFTTGWIGGGISSYALMKLGGEKEYNRAISTLRALFKKQAGSGLFYASISAEGEVIHDGYSLPGTDSFTLIRRSADVLYYIFKHFEIMTDIPEEFIKGAKKCADVFLSIFNKYGQMGQFVNADTGEIRVGGSASGAMIGAGLVSAYRYFGDEKYLTGAKAISEYYYQEYLAKGYTTGGPAEILQCPDSESAFALLESFVELYDVTKEKKWLDYAEFAAYFCSSWVVSYNYNFPKGSEFEKLNMKTIGTVFANVQNKHSAPGICTLSGSSLAKLYKFTGNIEFYQLYKEISTTIGQYMSTQKRPIYSWDVPKDAASLGLLNQKVAPEMLREGYICERVNMSDWETDRCVGGVFNGSCWPEVSYLLTLAEEECQSTSQKN